MADKINFDPLKIEFRQFHLEEQLKDHDLAFEARVKQICERSLPKAPNHQHPVRINTDLEIQLIHADLDENPRGEQEVLNLLSALINAYLEKNDYEGLTQAIDALLPKYFGHKHILSKLRLSLVHVYLIKQRYEKAIEIIDEALKVEGLDLNIKAGFQQKFILIYLRKKEFTYASLMSVQVLNQPITDPKLLLELRRAEFSAFVYQSDPDDALAKVTLEVEKNQDKQSLRNLLVASAQKCASHPNLQSTKRKLEKELLKPNFFAFLCSKLSHIYFLELMYDNSLQIATMGLSEETLDDPIGRGALYERVARAQFAKKNYAEALRAVQFNLDLKPPETIKEELLALREKVLEAKSDIGGQT